MENTQALDRNFSIKRPRKALLSKQLLESS